MSESAATARVKTEPRIPESGCYRWTEPNSHITVCLSLEAMDRLQADVLRAIDSSPRARREVGGILLGRVQAEESSTLIFVDEFEPVISEHLNGPYYTLSPEDTVTFEAALAWGHTRRTQSVVGYYRSHNRPSLFLSPDDLRLIQRYFPGPDYLFLLIKTLPNRACTAGFFFWKDGHIQSESTGSEAPLIPITVTEGSPDDAAVDAIDNIDAAPPVPELAYRRTLRRWIPGMVAAGVAAGAAITVMEYRASQPAHRAETRPAPTVAASPSPAPPPGSAPASPVREALASAVKNSRTQPANEPVAQRRAEPAEPTPAPAPEEAVAGSPVAVERSAPPASKTADVNIELPPASALPRPVETGLPPATQVTPPPLTREPVATAVSAPPRDTNAPAPPNIPTSSAARNFAGPRLIQQATPAVPRGVGTGITTEVQVDVEVALDDRGKVTRARVTSTKGATAGLLTIEALKAAQMSRFQPAQENGRNVASVMVITFRFGRTPN